MHRNAIAWNVKALKSATIRPPSILGSAPPRIHYPSQPQELTMALIRSLYLAMLTRSPEDSGTDSRINLIINEGAIKKLEHRFGDTTQEDQETGQANLYRLDDVQSARIESTRLADGSINVGILGDDEWRPELLFLWAKATRGPGHPPTMIVPLAIATDIREKLSTDDEGAVSSISLRMVRTGDSTMPIRRLLLIVSTGFDAEAGFGEGVIGDGGPSDKDTDDPIELQVVAGGHLVVQHVLPDTTQDDLESGQANVYTVPVAVPFTRTMIDSVRLRILGEDLWLPSRVYLFGLNNAQGRPDSIIPLVHVDRWGITPLSTDSAEGTADRVLPLVPRPLTAPTDGGSAPG
jgi:hypothetical protein